VPPAFLHSSRACCSDCRWSAETPKPVKFRSAASAPHCLLKAVCNTHALPRCAQAAIASFSALADRLCPATIQLPYPRCCMRSHPKRWLSAVAVGTAEKTRWNSRTRSRRTLRLRTFCRQVWCIPPWRTASRVSLRRLLPRRRDRRPPRRRRKSSRSWSRRDILLRPLYCNIAGPAFGRGPVNLLK